jgi:Tol biopolymer transport system component
MKSSTLMLAMALTSLAAPVLSFQVAAQQGASGTNGQIAFSRQIDPDTTGIFIANPDGSSEQQVPLPSDNKVEGGATWSRDGSRLLISHTLRFDDAGNCCLPFRPAILKPDGSNFTLLEIPDGPFDMDCTVWLSQDRLLCGFGDQNAGIFSIRASDGGDPVRLTTYPFGACNACDTPGDVSPDAKRFVFLRYRREVFHQTFRAEQVALFVEKTDGTGLRQLTPYGLAFPHELASAKWSPNGLNIISTMHDGRLLIVHPDGTGLTQIKLQTGSEQYFAFRPDWSPDGTRIIFGMFINDQVDIYTANPDGSNVVQVTHTPDFENGPDWGTHPIAP